MTASHQFKIPEPRSLANFSSKVLISSLGLLLQFEGDRHGLCAFTDGHRPGGRWPCRPMGVRLGLGQERGHPHHTLSETTAESALREEPWTEPGKT